MEAEPLKQLGLETGTDWFTSGPVTSVILQADRFRCSGSLQVPTSELTSNLSLPPISITDGRLRGPQVSLAQVHRFWVLDRIGTQIRVESDLSSELQPVCTILLCDAPSYGLTRLLL